MILRPLRYGVLIGLMFEAFSACSSKTTDLGPSPITTITAGQGGGGRAASGGTGGGGGTGDILNVTPGGAGGAVSTHPTLAACPACQWVDCPAGSATTVSGIVYTPAKSNADPLYNAVVYVPSSEVEPFSSGVSCDHCGNVSGKPIAAALSGTDGKFSLGGLPTGKGVPLVLQLGRWRRQVTIPEIKACVDNPLPAELTRFPRNQMEGDIPAMALVSSPYDPEECILRKIGIDDSEFTLPTGPGRVHFFVGGGATLGPDTPDGWSLWGTQDELKRYDLVLLPCASTPENVGFGDGEHPEQAVQAARAAVAQYANAGGRVFTTDLSDSWLTEAGSPFTQVAQWADEANQDALDDGLRAFIDPGFPKGKALSDWLAGIGATPQPGELNLNETFRRSLAVNAPTQRWLYTTDPASLQSFTFNTPLDVAPEQQCGRVLYSSFHIAGGSFDIPGPDAPTAAGSGPDGNQFPGNCNSAPLTPQERVLEFMLFDLASCVQVDMQPPQPPEIVK